MDRVNDIKRVKLIYFSGSGGTERIAKAFEKELAGRGIDVMVRNLGAAPREKKDVPEGQGPLETDFNILIYAVHAMDAPKPVYDWIDGVGTAGAGRKIAVFSVSGGGDMWPNKGSRNSCCKALEAKGFEIVYDRMMCMPANVLIEYNDHLVMRLINVVPKKVSGIVDDLLAGNTYRTHFRKGCILNWVSVSERKNAGKFAQGLRISEDCTGCGWCADHCPVSNIKMSETVSKPEFADRCVICTRCVYGCPVHALKANSIFELKNGFDLNAVERRMQGVELDPVEKCGKGWISKGVRDYLLDKY